LERHICCQGACVLGGEMMHLERVRSAQENAYSAGFIALRMRPELTRLILMFVLSRYVVTHRDQNLHVDSSAFIVSTASGLLSILILETPSVVLALVDNETPLWAISRRCTMCSSISERSFRIVCHLIAILWSCSARRSRQDRSWSFSCAV